MTILQLSHKIKRLEYLARLSSKKRRKLHFIYFKNRKKKMQQRAFMSIDVLCSSLFVVDYVIMETSYCVKQGCIVCFSLFVVNHMIMQSSHWEKP